MGGSPSNARSAMFELMRAVNERQAATNTTKTQFYHADGTLASDVAMADLLYIYGSGSNSFNNLTKVRDAIIAMANGGKFTTTSGGSTTLTKAWIETALGEDLDLDPVSPQEARYWQTMQDALDLLIYSQVSITPPFTFTAASRARIGSSMSSPNGAWSDAISDTPADDTRTEAAWISGPGGPPYGAEIYDDAHERFDLSAYAGDVVAGEFNVAVSNNCDIDINWAAGVVTGTVAALAGSYSGTHSWTNTYSTGGNLDIPVEITTAIPATNPFLTFSSSVTVRISSATFYIDLSSALSDQA